MASSSRLKPKEKGKIRVLVDVNGKLGKILKTVEVYTNDYLKPISTLTLSMYVKDEFHAMGDKYRAREIFYEPCKSCHTDRGKGLTGYALFRTDCIMCHNVRKSASPISEMRKLSRERVIKAIKEGVMNTAMPGFGANNGGPLNKSQIESLVSVIKP
jgi:mono/diheme cytochrome c family protein